MRHPFATSSAALLALSCFLHVTPAHAETFLFTASAPNDGVNNAVTATGTADPNVIGAFDLTGGVGTWNGQAITLYLPSATAGTFATANFTAPPFSYNSTYEYDNVVYTSGNAGLVLDQYGLLFSSATDHYNPFTQGAGYAYSDDEVLNGFNAPLYTVTLTEIPPTVTPEPTSIALLGTGLLGTVGILRRRRTA